MYKDRTQNYDSEIHEEYSIQWDILPSGTSFKNSLGNANLGIYTKYWSLFFIIVVFSF